MKAQYVPEIDIIIAVVKWLHLDGWIIGSLSLPRGQGIDSVGNKSKLADELIALGIEQKKVRLLSKGEDIRARQGSCLWRIECKGLGTDLPPSTVRNNFDRTVASTVSYYTQNDGLRLGLAVPDDYLKFLRNRVPRALRVAINLWIFLCSSSDDVYVFAPDEEIPKES